MFKEKNRNSNESSNFWISYADLMAGLLFVFILLIGSIMVKSTTLRNILHDKETILDQQKEALTEQKEALNEQEEVLDEQSDDLIDLSQNIAIKTDEITKLRNLLARREASLSKTNKDLIFSKESLRLKSNELNKLNQLLLAQNTKIDNYSNHIVLLQNLTQEQNSTLSSSKIELDNYKNKVILLSNSLTKQDKNLKMNEEKLHKLLQALDNKQTKYDKLLENLQAQKAKIKSLTGIKLKVIAELKASLGNKINIDKESGSLRLASNILFDKGSATLKNGAKKELKANFIEYVNALISNPNIKKHLDKIIIEGHSDSDGSYLYNLDLSQKRAFAVMHYLLTLDYIKKHNIKEKLVASGRSYLDNIKVNGVEDKDASRRIEVKFRLKNEDAMYEIERILDAD
jgi:chemotaxis protein MotB